MPIPQNILSVARPKNTVVIAYGKDKNLYAVRQRIGCRNDSGRHLPINGPTIGHIIDGVYVPIDTSTPVSVSASPIDLKDWANIILCDRLFAGIQQELFAVYSKSDAMKIYCISILRVCDHGIRDYELKEAYEAAVGYSHKSYVLVEEKLNGKEIGVDGMVKDGEVMLIAPHTKYTYKFKGATIPAGHSFPYRNSEKVLAEIDKQVTLAVKALGLNNCAFNSDVFVDGENVYIIEMGGRAGATGIPELISIYYGFDFYEKMIENSLGKMDDLGISGQRTACMSKLLMSPVDGTITSIDEDAIDKIRARGYDIVLDYKVGQTVEQMHNGTTRIGHLIARTDDEQIVNGVMDEIYAAICADGTPMKDLWKK